MKEGMKIRIVMSALVLTANFVCHAQAVPTAESPLMSSSLGPNLPSLDGVVHYALSASEIVQYGYYGPGDVSHSTDLTGDIAYTSKSSVRPFGLLFAGGVILANQSGQGTSTFWNISASQGYITRHWAFNISDSFSFLPQSPTTGLSGIAGVGDLGAFPISGPTSGPAGGILTTSGDRIGNALTGSVERQIAPNTSISGSGSWGILHYLDDNAEQGLDSTQITGVVALNQRLDARSSASIDAVYSDYYFTGPGSGPDDPGFTTRGINLSYQRVLSRSFSASVSAGPQWVSSSNSLLIPSMLNVAVSASLSYGYRNTHASVNYSRGVNNGSGVLPGALSDGVSGTVGHTWGRNWLASLSAAYTHTSGLTQVTNGDTLISTNEVFNTVYGGGQVTRRISTHFSAYGSYTAQSQSNNDANLLATPFNVLNGTSQTFGVGITFTPRSTNLGQF
jgi:hypothetical protein